MLYSHLMSVWSNHLCFKKQQFQRCNQSISCARLLCRTKHDNLTFESQHKQSWIFHNLMTRLLLRVFYKWKLNEIDTWKGIKKLLWPNWVYARIRSWGSRKLNIKIGCRNITVRIQNEFFSTMKVLQQFVFVSTFINHYFWIVIFLCFPVPRFLLIYTARLLHLFMTLNKRLILSLASGCITPKLQGTLEVHFDCVVLSLVQCIALELRFFVWFEQNWLKKW